jgi:trans-aconitate methyltransferase
MSTDPTQLWATPEAAERWQRTAAQREQAVGEATNRMFEAVALEPGFHVLDLAAGTGDTSIAAARRVGPDGSVLAVDISAAMLQEAARASQREGLSTIRTQVSDLVAMELPSRRFDAAICRFGLMFLTDVVEGLRRILDALKPNARLAALVWSTDERNPYMSIPLALGNQWGRTESETATTRRAVSLGGPGVFERALEQAGFIEISVQPVATPRDFDSLEAATEAMQQNSAVLRELLQRLDASSQAQALSELRHRLSEYVGADGRCVMPGEALLGVAAVKA